MKYLVVAGLLVFAACKNSADVVKQYKPKVEPRLEQMKASVTAAMSQTAGPTPLPEKLRLTGDNSNALLVQSSWLLGTPRDDGDNSILTPTGDVLAVKDALRGDVSGVPQYYENLFKTFLRTKYLIVVDASISTGVVTGENEFAGGGASGTLTFIDIDAAKLLSSESFSASHAAEISAVKGEEEKSLHSDLWIKLRAEANKALAPYLAPGEKPPL